MRLWLVCLLVGCVPVSQEAGVDESLTSPLQIATANGWIRGVTEGSARVFRGIPFAQPPVGALRWARPQPPSSWSGVRDASSFRPDCIGVGLASGSSEDCLYLNVYAPTNVQSAPVMVWLHGGGNIANSAERDASSLAERGVIVVTVPYRLGVLGFIGHPSLTAEQGGASGNYALMDALAALDWVQHNVVAFGGDRTRVMLFGQSAGANDVNALLASPLSRGLFSRAGMESDVLSPGQALTRTAGEQLGVQLATAVGCTTLDCLRQKSAAELISSVPAPGEIIVDGHVLIEDPIATLARRGPGMPLLIGSTRDEYSNQHDPAETLAAADYVPTVEAEFPQLKGKVAQRYPLSQYSSPLHALIAVESDGITCGVRGFALQMSRFVPVYRYLWMHTLENGTPLTDFLGAYHTQEGNFIFGEFSDGPAAGHVPTPAELALENLVQGLWTRFAATGDPARWPRYDGRQILYLDDKPVIGADWHVAQCAALYGL